MLDTGDWMLDTARLRLGPFRILCQQDFQHAQHFENQIFASLRLREKNTVLNSLLRLGAMVDGGDCQLKDCQLKDWMLDSGPAYQSACP